MVAKTTRFLAPIALLAVAFGVYTIVHSNLAPRGATTSTVSSSHSSIVNARRHGVHRGRRAPRFYTVRSGDTLSAVANKTKVGVDTLLKLNPKLQASQNNLQIGQRLRLRR
ncbi:MAG: LysM peptidoglycan-binding domain-containing protein [Solirubrobacteraceae bacterium]